MSQHSSLKYIHGIKHYKLTEKNYISLKKKKNTIQLFIGLLNFRNLYCEFYNFFFTIGIFNIDTFYKYTMLKIPLTSKNLNHYLFLINEIIILLSTNE